MKKYALGFIAILVIALLTPGLGSAATYGTDLWTTLKSYNFVTQSTWDSNIRLKPIESFADGESAFAHYVIGSASGQHVAYTAPFNTAGYKTIAVSCFTSTAGSGSTTVLTTTGYASYIVDVWGRLGKDDVWDSVTLNNYKGPIVPNTTAGGSVAKGEIYEATIGAGSITDNTSATAVVTAQAYTPDFYGAKMTFRVSPETSAGALGTKIWDTGGAYGAVIFSASACGVAGGVCATTHIMIRATK